MNTAAERLPDIAGSVTLRPGAEQRVRSGHGWVFSNELRDGFQDLPPGAMVEVHEASGKFVGIGSLNPRSLISVRLFSRERQAVNRPFLTARIREAARLRHRVLGADDNCCRLVYSESDGLPGLIIDRFEDVLVVQVLTAGMESLMPTVVEILQAELHPRAVILANDSPVREYENLPLARALACGEMSSPLRFAQDGIQFIADLLGGQKTGFFFDQRMNRRLVQSFLPADANVLDLFSYTGAFGLYALQAGAAEVLFVDDSNRALDLAQQAAAANGWSERARFLKEDIFPWLSSHEKMYDLVIVDPPALAKSRAKVAAALRAYRDLNARAITRVKPGGLLATSSCSGLVTPAAWRDALKVAGHKARRRVRILAQGSQASDHPVLVSMPETEYLKFAILTVDDTA